MNKTNNFEISIKAYLDDFANKDEYFAARYDESKISDCCNYIINQVKDSRRNGFTDDEIYQLATHFYLEGLEPGDKVNATVIVNHQIELTEEEKAKAKEEAYQNLVKLEEQRLQKEKEREAKKEAKKLEKQAQKAKEELKIATLFDDMFGDEEDGS